LRAKADLTKNGWSALSDIECAELALDIAEAYANSLLAKANAASRAAPAI
jgi:hypothetical protein